MCFKKTFKVNSYSSFVYNACSSIWINQRKRNNELPQVYLLSESKESPRVSFYFPNQTITSVDYWTLETNHQKDHFLQEYFSDKSNINGTHYLLLFEDRSHILDLKNDFVLQNSEIKLLSQSFTSRKKNRSFYVYSYEPACNNIKEIDLNFISDTSKNNMCLNGSFEKALPYDESSRILRKAFSYSAQDVLLPSYYGFIPSTQDNYYPIAPIMLVSKEALSGKYSLCVNSPGNQTIGFHTSPIKKQNCSFSLFVKSISISSSSLRIFIIANSKDNNTPCVYRTFSFSLSPQRIYHISADIDFKDSPVNTDLFYLNFAVAGSVIVDNIQVLPSNSP